ncbi:MAG: YczE/YyaS/YitT family protein [Anaerolineae bacterium]
MRLLRLILGLFLYALGIVFTLNAHVGYAPWDVLHVGFAKTVGLSIGNASIVVGVVIVLVTVLLKEKLGLGTMLNMVLIGVFIDLILEVRLVPTAESLALGIIMLIVGLFIIALASYYYIGSALGTGPRDSLMVALARKTRLPVGACRGIIEVVVVLVGWRLGGMLGVGTVVSAFAIGFCIQITFKLLRFDPTAVRHESLGSTYRAVFERRKEGSTEARGVQEH